MQSHFAHFAKICGPIPVGGITFELARSSVEFIANGRKTPYIEVSFARHIPRVSSRIPSRNAAPIYGWRQKRLRSLELQPMEGHASSLKSAPTCDCLPVRLGRVEP